LPAWVNTGKVVDWTKIRTQESAKQSIRPTTAKTNSTSINRRGGPLSQGANTNI